MPTVNLTLAEFAAAAERGNVIPVYAELLADGDTPVSAFAKLGSGPHAFLLESVVGGEKWAAYSFIGVSAHARFTARGGRYEIQRFGSGPETCETGACPGGDPTRALEAWLATFRPVEQPGLPRFFGGAVGYLSYDAVRALERLPETARDELSLPDAAFVLTETLLIFDNLRQTVKVVVNALCETLDAAPRVFADACARIDQVVAALARPVTLEPMHPGPRVGQGDGAATLFPQMARQAFLSHVARAKEYIFAGDVFQVVLSQRFTAPPADPFQVYRALRVVNPSPYMFHLAFEDAQVTGASPEVLVRVEGRRIELRPIAGTRPRGRSNADDQRLEAELVADPKERAEHVMLIDLGRNDVGRVARAGSVRVEEQFKVERYSHVMHLTSSVAGELAEGRTALDALRAAFPAGTLTGAPKIRAMQIIEELEPTRRGVYGGAVGYVSFTGNIDFAIAIRTLVSRAGAVYVQAGAGIVADSVPEAEYEETVAKARAVARALGMARGEG
jgi:anthranilate synthase component 1